MRKALIIILLFIAVAANATTYYVATPANGGNDSNAGTISSPFASWNKLSSVLVAGDIAYIRGGTYRTTFTTSANQYLNFTNLKGTSGSPITIAAYPGEKPVFNLDNMGPSTASYLFVVYVNGCTYVNFKGLQITGAKQNTNGAPIFGMGISNSPNCNFEQIEVDHIGGYGISVMSGSNNIIFKNCDVHHCVDLYGNPNGNNAPYEDANGFGITGGSTATNITFDGCRAWKMADDGWDTFLSDGVVTWKNCWSFLNGYDDNMTRLGDGGGFKLGPFQTNKSTTHVRTLMNCISAGNGSQGFDQNTTTYTGIYWFYNNIAYKNGGIGFHFSSLPGTANVFKNNIQYANGNSYISFGSGTIMDHNSWNGGVTVSDADFVNLDINQLANPRQADGSLPAISFLNLKAGSDLIDAGTNVGLDSKGNAPDLGPFEADGTTPAPVVVTPVYTSSVIANATPAKLEMTYNTTLASVVPATTSFSVLVNSAARNVTAVAVAGTKVTLTLASAVVNGDVVTVAYTKPATNPIQTSTGGQAVTTGALAVTNSVAAVVVSPTPVYVSSVVENAAPTVLEMTYSTSLANIVPSASAFSVSVNSIANSVKSVAISGTKVILTLASAVLFGDIVTVSYTKPTTNWLQTITVAAVSISSQSVTNKCLAATTPPTTTETTAAIRIFPNPAHNFFNIMIEDATLNPQIIKIFDLAGKQVFTGLIEQNVKKVQIPINLSTGVYIISLYSGTLNLLTQKLLINN